MNENLILSRWIKDERIRIEITEPKNIGLKGIKFFKYNFNSNDSNASLDTWLSLSSYQDTQYIGFFKLDEISSFFNNDYLTDKFSRFITSNFFTFNINEIFTNNRSPVSLKELSNVTLSDVIKPIDDIVQYFEPPIYNVIFEDGAIKSRESNDGEIDIVAKDMSVYGLLTTTPLDIITSSKNSDFTKINNGSSLYEVNYSIINKVLQKLREEHIVGVPTDLLSIDGIHMQEFYNLVLEYYEKFIVVVNTNKDKIRKFHDHFKFKSQERFKEYKKDFLNALKAPTSDMEIEVLKRKYKIYALTLKKFGDDKIVLPRKLLSREKKYYEENYLQRLLYITSCLNNPSSRDVTIRILEEMEDSEPNSKKSKSRQKYIKYKMKYLELKKKMN